MALRRPSTFTDSARPANTSRGWRTVVERLADGLATLVTLAELVGFPGLRLIERRVRTPSDRGEP
jgi:hypothetical protein